MATPTPDHMGGDPRAQQAQPGSFIGDRLVHAVACRPGTAVAAERCQHPEARAVASPASYLHKFMLWRLMMELTRFR